MYTYVINPQMTAMIRKQCIILMKSKAAQKLCKHTVFSSRLPVSAALLPELHSTERKRIMIDFSKGGAFDLHKVPNSQALADVSKLFISGEMLVGVYQTARDQVIFTNKRIITIDVKGMIGSRKEIFILPYARIQYFGIQTPGLIELIPDAELSLVFANGTKVDFEFKGQSDILEIGRAISWFALQ